MRRRILAALAAALMLSGCSPLEELPQEEETFFPPQAAEPRPPVLPEVFSLPVLAGQPLNPLTCPDEMQMVASLLYEGLFRLDGSLTPQALLCADWHYDAAALTYTLTLRQDAAFSDGTALTAADVAASLKAAMGSPRYAQRLSAIRSASAVDGQTVRLRLHRPHNALPALLDVPIFRSGTQNDDVPLGTGPYCYDEETGALRASAHWWQDKPRPVEQIALQDTADREAMLYRFQARAVQVVAADLTGTEGAGVSGGAKSVDADTTVMHYIGVNVRRLESAPLRQCLSVGIGRETLTGTLLSGHARATQFPVSPASPLYPTDLEQPASPEVFAAALARVEALPEAPLQMIVNEENPFKVSLARQIAEDFSAAGVETEVQVLAWADFQAALAQGAFDLYYGEVRLGADWDLTPLLGTGGAINYTGWSDAECDALLSAALGSEERTQALRQLWRYLRQEAPLVPVCFKKTSLLYDPAVVEGLRPTAAEPFAAFSQCIIHLREP